ncbi:MAG: ammonium transporter [Melioribacteraceae bacterium]|nr:ammonium transporter [Melioribacteraceae bacterium]
MDNELTQSITNNLFTINNLWMMIATALVFIMHLGFASLEAGLTRSKNTVNILFKNSIIPAIGIITYTLIGFNLMYPGEGYAGAFFGLSGLGISTDAAGLTPEYNLGYTYWTDFLFQAMFAATAATIVSGAVAERIKLSSFLLFSTLFVGIIYPMVGMWKWGGGFLDSMDTPFYDFAGSTIVHSVGGWGALTGVIFLGPRIGKYVRNKISPIPGHSMPLAAIGVFLLWLGWFGFNGGSVLSADPGLVSLVLVTTSLAASAGAVAAMISSWLFLKKPDITMVLNGILAGLVGITAGADLMGPVSSVLIGLISGTIVVFSVIFFDKIKIDDPVGALSVHLVCGIFGTLAVGIFGDKAGFNQFLSQLIGVISTAVFVGSATSLIWFIIKKSMGIRVSPEEETEGLDLGEHAMEAYPDFEKVS